MMMAFHDRATNSRFAQPLAYFFLAVALAAALWMMQRESANTTYYNQIQACRRDNVIRRDLEHVRTAAKLAVSVAATTSTKRDARHAYARIALQLTPVPPLDCSQILRRP